jgi:hypothetical protein
MAKRKLSLQQRKSIREEIRRHVAQKKGRAEILNGLAGKYGFTTATARWYYTSVVRPTARPAKQAAKRGTRRAAVRTSVGAPLTAVRQLQSAAETHLKRLLEAKRLIPKWQGYVKRASALRKLEKRVKSDLRTASSQASALGRKIRDLTSH